jgi:hypothetical protein
MTEITYLVEEKGVAHPSHVYTGSSIEQHSMGFDPACANCRAPFPSKAWTLPCPGPPAETPPPAWVAGLGRYILSLPQAALLGAAVFGGYLLLHAFGVM